MADGAATDIGLRNLAHLDGAHNARLDIVALESILKRKGVHAGGEHADVVGLGTVHAFCRTRHAAEDVAAADGDGQLDAVVDDLFDLDGELFDHLRVDAVAGVAHQGLAGELEQDALVLVVFLGHLETFRTSRLCQLIILPDCPFTIFPILSKGPRAQKQPGSDWLSAIDRQHAKRRGCSRSARRSLVRFSRVLIPVQETSLVAEPESIAVSAVAVPIAVAIIAGILA